MFQVVQDLTDLLPKIKLLLKLKNSNLTKHETLSAFENTFGFRIFVLQLRCLILDHLELIYFLVGIVA